LNRRAFLRPACVAILCSLLVLLTNVSQSQPQTTGDVPAPKSGKPAAESLLEVRFTDNSVMKLAIKDERIAVTTPYGKLNIPVADIRRIEFGLRVSDEVAKRIEAAVADLGHPEFRNREAASAILFGLREKGYPAIVKASNHTDAEVAARAEALVKKIEETVPAELLKPREFDVIHTENSKIAGKIDASTLKADSKQFGEVKIRLEDAYVLSTKSTEPEADTTNVAVGPANLLQHQNEIGKTFSFKVTGAVNGSLWGTDVYTTDSTLAMAAVHCGLVKPGQTGIVKVTIMASPQVFVGSTRNGVTSQPYQQYPAAYRVHK
jgi:hypothetical protein